MVAVQRRVQVDLAARLEELERELDERAHEILRQHGVWLREDRVVAEQRLRHAGRLSASVAHYFYLDGGYVVRVSRELAIDRFTGEPRDSGWRVDVQPACAWG